MRMLDNFDPGGVLMGRPSSGYKPYVSLTEQQKPTSTTLGAEAVRATGTGPFDPTYRQNLAAYAGGQFARPGGNLSFNPTGDLFGPPTGGGTAPLPGMPYGLLDMALGGTPFRFQPPQQTLPSPTAGDGLDFWMKDFNESGRLLRASY